MYNVYQCLLCETGRLSFEFWTLEGPKCGVLVCGNCGEMYELRYGVLNAVKKPSDEYIEYLEDIRKECEQKDVFWVDFAIQSGETRLPNTEIQAHILNFESVAQFIRLPGASAQNKPKVLVLGCRETLYYLKWFREKGCLVFGCDQYMFVNQEAARFLDGSEYPPLAVCEFARLPYWFQEFDLVVISHTLCEQTDMPAVMSEVARVLKEDGAVLLLNEAMRSMFSFADNYQFSDRKYSFNDYDLACQSAGFNKLTFYFPEYHHQLLTLGRVRSFSWRWLAKIMVLFWKNSWLRRQIRRFGILPAHILLGIPLNAMLERLADVPVKNRRLPIASPWQIDLPPDSEMISSQHRIVMRGDVGDRRGGDRAPDRDRRKESPNYDPLLLKEQDELKKQDRRAGPLDRRYQVRWDGKDRRRGRRK